MKDPTPEQVRAFWAYMLARFKCEVVDKATSGRMAAAGWFLDLLGIMDRETFLDRYTTTIGSTIFAPFKPGDTDRDLWHQCELLTHEIEHATQFRRDGFLPCATRYLTSDAERAQYEAEALRAESEVAYWRTGSVPDPAAMANKLKAYSVGPAEIEHVAEYLRASRETTERGGVISEVARAAIEWLDENAPELKHGS